MPGRIEPLVINQIYHVFNRGIDRRPTFLTKKDYDRAIEAIAFYQFASPPIRLSVYRILGSEQQVRIMERIRQNPPLVEILCYCLMPNHFHFVVKQVGENGISKFISNLENSYTKYFNTKKQRIGPLFLNQFKAVRVEDDDQLQHVVRYTHLNPYSAYVVKTLTDLESYPWSSLPEYLGKREGLCRKEMILASFKNQDDYKQFVFDQADYQRNLEAIKHLTLEENS